MKTIPAFVVLVITLATCSLAQYGAPAGASSSAVAATTKTGSSAAATHTVSVGTSGLSFSPDTLTAAGGSILEFHFAPGNIHSVTQSTFASPCKSSGSNGIFSGFTASADVFQVTVNSTDPLWLYCSQVTHCQSGMAMVVNPASSGGQTLSAYQAAAKNSGSSTAPSNSQGGVVVAASSLSKTSSSSSSSSSVSSGGAVPTGALLPAGGAAALLAMAAWVV